MSGDDVRIAVVGAGMMGTDHARRLATTVAGARVSVIVDADQARAEAVAASIPGAAAVADPSGAFARDDVDAVVLATTSVTHEPILLAALEHDLPVLCEKPLTPDPESSLRVLEAEQTQGRRLIQVGFMRRFDREYRDIRALVDERTTATCCSCTSGTEHRTPCPASPSRC
jgi:myo-inositol 2-dehydrogenase / D-chiro-inositol 1-dehydrogenase